VVRRCRRKNSPFPNYPHIISTGGARLPQNGQEKRDRLLYRRALKLCEGAVNGELNEEIARQTFIAASQDAELLAAQREPLTEPG
jgi:hypothetical protein